MLKIRQSKPEILLVRPASNDVLQHIINIDQLFGSNVQKVNDFCSALNILSGKGHIFKVLIVNDHIECNLDEFKRFLLNVSQLNIELKVICLTYNVRRIVENGFSQLLDPDNVFDNNVRGPVIKVLINPYLKQKSP